MKLNIFLKGLLCLLLTGIGGVHAQSLHNTATNFNGWGMYFGTVQLSDRWSLHDEVQLRRNGPVQHPQQVLLRGGVSYKLKPGVKLTAGYGFVETYPYGDQPVVHTFPEHRIWEQVQVDETIGRVRLQHRYRLEQRWLQTWSRDAAGTAVQGDWQYRNRMRYLVRATVPLNHKDLSPGTVFLSAYDEVMVNFGKHVADNIFDQNRLYGAVGYQVNANLNVQAGMLLQTIEKSNGTNVEQNPTLQLGVTHTLDLRKKD